VRELCALFEVSRSGYYAHCHKADGLRHQQDEVLAFEIKEVHEDSRGTYGCRRVMHALRAAGIRCGKTRVSRVMKSEGLVARRKRCRNPHTTNSDHELAVLPNLLRDALPTTAVNQRWVSDITYIPTKEGWLYLAGTLDCHSRELVGWQTSSSPSGDLVVSAAERAFWRQRPGEGLIYHSDRGIQYASRACRQLLAQQGAQQSMSRKGNCYDNAMMESFWATLKAECFGGFVPATRDEAKEMLFSYIEIFYNRKRLHSALGYCSPLDFKMQTGLMA
jgi:transposase InsO family protein